MLIESILRGLGGILLLLGIMFFLSNNRSKVNWRLVGGGLLIQIVLAVFIIKGDSMREFFEPLGWPIDFFRLVSSFFVVIFNLSAKGAEFVFGSLAHGPEYQDSLGIFFAFQVLPTIIFFASLMSVLYYLGVMQRIVQGMAWVMSKIMGTSGAESLSVTADIFLGQTESPLMIRPFLKSLTQSELLTIMIGGMATIAGGVMAAFIQILGTSWSKTMSVPLDAAQLSFATHLLSASVISAPAAMLIAKILYPETTTPETYGSVKIKIEKNASNVIESAANGASDGLKLALNVGAMLIAFIALITLLNSLLSWVGEWSGINGQLQTWYGEGLSLQFLCGWFFQWLAYGIGVPWEHARDFGGLIGTKLVLNEFVAYIDLGNMIAAKEIVNEKVIVMATYALCGFANFSSIAIQIGGIGPLAPERKTDLAKLGIKALIGGSAATLLSATIAGMFY